MFFFSNLQVSFVINQWPVSICHYLAIASPLPQEGSFFRACKIYRHFSSRASLGTLEMYLYFEILNESKLTSVQSYIKIKGIKERLQIVMQGSSLDVPITNVSKTRSSKSLRGHLIILKWWVGVLACQLQWENYIEVSTHKSWLLRGCFAPVLEVKGRQHRTFQYEWSSSITSRDRGHPLSRHVASPNVPQLKLGNIRH